MSKVLRVVVLAALAAAAPAALFAANVDLRVVGVTGSPNPITLNTGNITYSVQVFNADGTTTGTSPVLTSTIPSSSTYVSSSATGGGSCSQSAGTVTCNWATIGASSNYFVTIIVTPTAGGSLTLSSSVSGADPDPTPANNSATGSVTVNDQIDLRVVGVTGSPNPITLNTGNVTYSTQLFNNSSSQGTNTVLTMTIPAASTYVSASVTGGGSCSQSAGVVTCTWTSIGASVNYFATVIVTPTAGGTATLSASASGTEPDSNNANNTASGSVTVNDQIDLRVVSVTGSPNPITLNTGNITYSTQLFNNSTSQGTGTVLTMTIPSASTYVSASVTGGGSCSQSAGVVTCNWTSIGASVNYFATVIVTPTAGGTATLSATASGTEPDSNNANNTVSGSVTVNDQIDLRVVGISGTPDPITFAGGNVTFTIQLFNNSTSQGRNPVLTVTLPSNSTYVSSTPTNSGTCTPSAGTVTCSWSSIGASSNFFPAIVVTPTIPGTLTLSATASGTQPDPNSANNSGSKTTTVTPTSCTAIPSGAVAWYRAQNNGVDSIGPNLATANGSATCTTGEVGQAFSLNGTTAYVSAPDNVSLHLTSALTIEGWFFLTGGSGVRTIVAKTVGSSFSNSFVVYIAANGAIAAAYGDTSSIDGFSTSTFPTTNAWHHFAYTYDGTTQQLFLDGASAGSAAATTAIGYDTHPLLIGADIDNEALISFFPGRVDELAIYNRVLSSTEIQTVYGAGTFGKCYVAAPAPTITGFTPASGNSGTSVVITGTDFTAVSAVKFNGTSATFTGDSSTQISAIVPASATTGAISVVTGGGTGTSGSNFTVLTTAHWINSSGGNWNTAGNWSTGSVPTASNDVVIDAAGTYTVNLDVTPAFYTLTVGGGATGTQTLELGVSHDVTFTNPGTVTSTGALTFGSGRLLGAGPLTVNGTMNWSSDSEIDTPVNIASGASLNISGTGTRFLNGGTINNSGTVTWSGTDNISIYNSGVINNLAGGLFSVTNDQLIYQHCCGIGQAVNNAGTFRKSVATGTTTIDGNGFNNSGTLDVQSGTFLLGSGGTSTGVINAAAAGTVLVSSVYTLGTGATLTGSGDIQISAAQLNVSAAGVTVNHLTLAGGNLNINSGASVSTTATGVIDWNADATLSGAGTLNIVSGGTLNFGGSGTRYIDGGTINNSGTVNWTGGNNISVYNSGVINNLAAGLFSVKNDQIIYQHCCGAGQAFNNAGTFRKSVATGTTSVNNNGFNNSGTVDIQSGTFALISGGTSTSVFNAASGATVLFNATTYTLGSGATLTGSGTFQISGGTLAVTGSGITVAHLTIIGGTLNITGSLGTTATGVIDWSGDSTLTGAGALSINSGGTLNISGSGTRFIDGGTLNNSGTVNWSGTDNISVYNSGVINNLASGLFSATNDQLIYQQCCGAGQPFNNAGTFRKSVATGTTSINSFNNTGTVDAQSGVITFSGAFTSSGSPAYDFGIGSATTYGRLAFASAAGLSGALTAAPVNSFVPQGGQQFQIISFPSSSATFAPKTLTYGSSPVRSFTDSYSATAVTLTASGPAVSGALSPNQGPGSGGTAVTITGTGFVSGGSLAVTFGGIAATVVTVVNANTITCTTPAHASGVVDVVITNGDGQPTTATNGFTYDFSPVVTAIRPSSGSVAGAGGVIIEGTNLSTVTAVTFGASSGTILSSTATQLVVAAPAHAAGTVNVAVTNPVGTYTITNGFTYIDSDDAARDFFTSTNPSTRWSYGYETSRGSTFNLHGTHGNRSGFDYWGSALPNLGRNSNSTTLQQATNFTPSMKVEMHPGSAGENSVIRWSAPATAQYRVHGYFVGYAPSFPPTTDVAILHNNSTAATLFSSNINSYNVPASFDVTTAFSAGDTVEFTVGFGSNGNFSGDGTGLDVTIDPAGAANADISITGNAPATVTSGANFPYTTIVTNNGPAAASNVTATIALPANITLNGLPSSTQGSCSGTTTITCSIGTL